MRLISIVLACAIMMSLPDPENASAFDGPSTVIVEDGSFISGSDRAERDYGYSLDEIAYGHSVTRKNQWYERELERAERSTGKFAIMKMPVTNAQYAIFVRETGHPAPKVAPRTWQGYRLIHPYERTLKFQWKQGLPQAGRLDHPVTMISLDDARAYAKWLSGKTGQAWRLPSELEWEKAVRGSDGRYFPWGNDWNPDLLNSHDNGPFDTVQAGQFPNGASPYGVLDGAGQAYEWVSEADGDGRHFVKGGAWDDKGCGVCRPAARHSRPDGIHHILIGFRLVYELE